MARGALCTCTTSVLFMRRAGKQSSFQSNDYGFLCLGCRGAFVGRRRVCAWVHIIEVKIAKGGVK